jgi:hypothetical protein
MGRSIPPMVKIIPKPTSPPPPREHVAVSKKVQKANEQDSSGKLDCIDPLTVVAAVVIADAIFGD